MSSPLRQRAGRRGGADTGFDRMEAAVAAQALAAEQSPSPEPVSPPALPVETHLVGVPVSPVDEFADGQVRTLAECEQHIAAVTHQWLLGVGRALKMIRDHKLYEQDGYSSFKDYVSHRWEWTPQRAHQLITSVPIVEIVAPHADREVREGQTRILGPVHEKHGANAVLEVWKEASLTGKPTATALERVARAKGYISERDAPGPAGAKALAAPQFLSRFVPVLEALTDLHALRQVALETPDKARELATVLRSAAEALEPGASAGS
ncbi:hypothetical protein [Streptosporangium sp. NPDC048865]|uniref:hypothetical protein n=1 Tax=Streptosporangium sp. NPDC048865 TaxID=3155766 RepID=UPI00341FC7A4